MTNKLMTFGALALATLLFTGCSDSPEVSTVTGVVLLDGKPLHSAEVVFCPAATGEAGGIVATGYTDEAGRFQVHASQAGQELAGVTPGTHVVMVRDLATRGEAAAAPTSPDFDQNVTAAAKKSRISKKFEDLKATPLRNVTVPAGEHQVTIELDSRKKTGTVTVASANS